jgi:hypothetical protein
MIIIIIIIIIIRHELGFDRLFQPNNNSNNNNNKLQTKYHATKTLQTETDNKCRLCKQFDETCNTSYQHAQYWKKNTI